MRGAGKRTIANVYYVGAKKQGKRGARTAKLRDVGEKGT